MTFTLGLEQSEISIPLRQWHSATWQDYLTVRNLTSLERVRLFFNQEWLWIDMGSEGINHASISDLFTMLFFMLN